MSVRQLVLQHLQQICNNVESFCQQTDSLVHLEITPDGLIDWLKLRFCPHEFRSVEDGTLQVDVDSQDEQFTDLHVDFTTSEVDATRAGNSGGNRLSCCDCCIDEIFV